MPIDFDKDLKTWRDAAPPETLKPRIAAALAPRPSSFRWKPACAALAACAAAGSVFLLWPGSPVRPLPAFADVENAMANVKIVSARKSFSVQMSNGKWWNREERVWIRRSPPALASRIETGAKPTTQQTLLDGRRSVTYYPRLKKWSVTKFQYDIQTVVTRALRGLTEPPTEANSSLKQDRWAVYATATPWAKRKEALNGKPVLRFDREVVTPGHTVAGSQGHLFDAETRTQATIWVDVQTLRIVKKEIIGTRHDQIISRMTMFDFHYDEPAPPGTFDLKPPKGTPTTTQR